MSLANRCPQSPAVSIGLPDVLPEADRGPRRGAREHRRRWGCHQRAESLCRVPSRQLPEPIERARSGPPHRKHAAAAPARDRSSMCLQLHAVAAAWTHPVAGAPAERKIHGVIRPRHDGPLSRPHLRDLQARSGDRETALADVQYRGVRQQPDDLVPRTAAQVDVHIAHHSGPRAHVRHVDPSSPRRAPRWAPLCSPSLLPSFLGRPVAKIGRKAHRVKLRVSERDEVHGFIRCINDDHPPPHFHVRYGRYRAILEIETAH